MSHGPSAASGKAEPNLVPLLDVVLQLIMFFMLTVNFVRTDQINEAVVLPESQTGVPLDKTVRYVLFLNMDRTGKLLVPKDVKVDTDSRITEYLRTQKEIARRNMKKNEDPDQFLVVLRAHKLAESKDVFRVLNLCIAAGIKRYQTRAMSQAES
jgi:biopolymer transport protein ExbD